MSEKNEPSVATHAVLYTDGGCMPPRGPAGYGIHGYLFTLEAPKQGAGCPKANPEKGGYEMKATGKPSITVMEYIDFLGTLPHDSTNNIAELNAALEAMLFVHSRGLEVCRFIMDSQYVLKGLTEWSKGWIARGWTRPDGSEVPNKQLWLKLLEVKGWLEADNVKLIFEWVKGHNGNIGNEQADLLASRAVSASMKDVVLKDHRITPAKGYWAAKVERNALFAQAGWLFNTHAETLSEDGRYIYHLLDLREKPELTGKAVSDSSYSVLFLKEPDPVMESVRTFQNEIDKGTANNLIYGELRHILHRQVYSDILTYGPIFMNRRTRFNLDVSLVGGTYEVRTDDDEKSKDKNRTTRDLLLTRELNPPRKAYTAVQVMGALESILESFLQKKPGYCYTDITDLIYDVPKDSKKTTPKIKSSLNVSVKAFDVEVEFDLGERKGKAGLSLVLGQDIAARNALSAMAAEGVKVTVVTWKESSSAFRVATIVENNDDAAIFASWYSNLHLMPR